MSWVWYWWEGATTTLASRAVKLTSLTLSSGVGDRIGGGAHCGVMLTGTTLGETSHNTSQLFSGLNWLLTACSFKGKKKGDKNSPCPPLSFTTPAHLKKRTKKNSPAILESYPIAGILVLSHENQCCWNTAFKQPHITSPRV